MENIKFDLSKKCGKFKYMNATNGGPWHKRHAADQVRSNLKYYKAARIPFSRNHDSAVCGVYGGPYSHDITCIFPNFDADPYSPDSYDFPCTDEAILTCLDAGTLHAIGEGIIIAEVQQNSNTTYRVSDYGRLGADGKARELHIDKALDVTKCEVPKIPYGNIGKVTYDEKIPLEN